jgi:beta-1,4-mannosyltransferase
MRGDLATRPLRLLLVLDPPDGTTRFVDQIVHDLPASIDVSYFTWKRALLSRYDVFHVHWPERLTRGGGVLGTLANRLALVALLLRSRLLRVAIVSTEHNLEPHEPGDIVEKWLFAWLRSWTAMTIRLNRATPVDEQRPNALIPHGHYRDRFARYGRAEPMPGRVVFFGIIREYKGVEPLLDAFRALPDPSLTLRLVGRPSTSYWRTLVEEAFRADARVSGRLEFVPDDVLVHEVTQAELVVLPYMEMHNSGAIFVALSLGRPVLAPRSRVNEELAAEVGPGWLHLYDGPLTADLLGRTLAQVREHPPSGSPAFLDRDWTTVGRMHAEAYHQAIQQVRGVRLLAASGR